MSHEQVRWTIIPAPSNTEDQPISYVVGVSLGAFAVTPESKALVDQVGSVAIATSLTGEVLVLVTDEGVVVLDPDAASGLAEVAAEIVLDLQGR